MSPYDRNPEQFKNKDAIFYMHIIKMKCGNAQSLSHWMESKSEAMQWYHPASLIQYDMKRFCQAMGQERRCETYK